MTMLQKVLSILFLDPCRRGITSAYGAASTTAAVPRRENIYSSQWSAIE